MAATKSPVGVQQSQPDEQEYRAIEQSIEQWSLPSKGHRAPLHIYEDCAHLQRSTVVHKDTAVYPYGYCNVCQYCLEEYRSD